VVRPEPYCALNVRPELQRPFPAEFRVWIHQLCGPAASVPLGVNEHVEPEQTVPPETQTATTAAPLVSFCTQR
jgi:hypothetical protein